MRRSAFLLVLAAISGSPAVSSTLVTTAQVEQLLISSRGRPDIEVAAEISGLELSERVSSERLDRWEKSFPGNHTHDALIALADSSEFHDLPAADRASAAPPNLLGQQQMLSRVIDYVSQAIPKLPNFFATRHTTSFEDIKQELSQQSAVSVSPQLLHSLNSSNIAPQLEHQPLQVVGTSTLAVTYRDGREVVDTQRAKDLKLGSEEAVFTTRGEFGPILGLVLGDAVRSSITWGHWEQSASGLHGVFHYSVPQAKSHYMVAFPGRMGPEQQFPAYHGEIMFDPASGSILRMTVIPNLKPPYQMVVANIAVEYAPVIIGGSTYICPVKAVAFSKVPIPIGSGTLPVSQLPLRTAINDISFIEYHVLRTQAHIVTTENAQPAGNSPAPIAVSSFEAPSTSPVAAQRNGSSDLESHVSSASDSAAVPAIAAGKSPTSPDEQSTPAGSGSVPRAIPSSSSSLLSQNSPTTATKDQPASTETSEFVPALEETTSAVVLHTFANTVLEDVVVTDKKKPVQGLDREQFHVFEDKRERPITFFEEHQPSAVPAALTQPVRLPANTYTNIPPYPKAEAVNVLLLDDLNTPLASQAQVRRQVLQYFHNIRAGTITMAVFVLSTQLRLIHGFTGDATQLTEALQSPKANPQASALDRPSDDSSIRDMQAMAKVSPGPVADLAVHIDQLQSQARAKDTGDRARATQIALQQLARYLNAIPGRKNLIWFSAFLPFELDAQTSQLLASARVAVYPVDTRGVCASAAVVADSGCKNFLQTQGSYDSMEKQIAAQTGGQAYSNTNGFGETMEKIIDNGSSYYALSYTPSPAQSNTPLRRIDIRLNKGEYQLAYRHDYYLTPSALHTAATSPIIASSLLGAPPATQIEFRAQVLSATDPLLNGIALENGPAGELTASLKGPVHRYAVNFTVDPHSLTFDSLPADMRQTEIELALVAYDAETRRVNYIDRSTRMTLTAKQYAQVMDTGLPIRLSIDLPTGQISLRAVICDRATSRTGSMEIPITIADK